jgi:predicted AlkP superfamily phosphohydrolase/phosphomutase
MLVIGVDAAEPKLVRKLIDLGDMPTLERLLSTGRWMTVESSAYLGSGSVWPSFITGEDAGVHGVYGEWLWQPETMDIRRYSGKDLTPFWKKLSERGVSVGLLDVPFMPMIGASNGFEISEWGAHDVLEGKTRVAPDGVADLIAAFPHPLTSGPAVSGPHDYKNLEKLGEACLNGIKLRGAIARDLLAETRPQLCLIAFTETHRAGHYLWHATEPGHAVYRTNGFANLSATQPNLKDLYREVDRQIGELVKTAGDDTPVMVFSLHGMKPAHGVVAFLAPLLCEMGYARLADWRMQSWRERLRAIEAKIKLHLPAKLKELYYKTASPTTTHRVARLTMLPSYDWDRTQAFSLPTDQHGYIRINLIGREAKGIVPPARYEELCAELEHRLRNLTSEDGKPLVRKVIRMADSAAVAMGQRIPDLVVHWEETVFDARLRIKGSAVRTENVGQKFVAQHSLEGFCILNAPLDAGEADVLHITSMHKLITRAFKAEPLDCREDRNDS